MSEEVDSSKLEELDKEADGTKVPKGGRYEGLADSMEELSAGRLRPGQSVTFGLHEVMVIKVVERTVIVEGAAVSWEKVGGSSRAAKTKRKSILVLLSALCGS
jgi:hypothetical protein